MIDINDHKKALFYMINKDGTGTTPNPSEYDMLVNRAVWEWTMKRFSNDKEYRPGRPIARVSFEVNQKLIDNMRHLKETHPLQVNGGSIPLPDGTQTSLQGSVMPEYLHLAALRQRTFIPTDDGYDKVESDVDVLKESEFGRRMNSTYKGPELQSPIATIRSNDLRIEPPGVGTVEIVYLRKPKKANWAYTTQNGRPVYDASNSTNIDAPEEAFNELLFIVAEYIGLNIREGALIKEAQLKQKTGT